MAKTEKASRGGPRHKHEPPVDVKAMQAKVGRKHVVILMRRMGIGALCRKNSTSLRHPEREVYPYLLRNVAIERANHVWVLDIIYNSDAPGVRVLLRGDGLGKPLNQFREEAIQFRR